MVYNIGNLQVKSSLYQFTGSQIARKYFSIFFSFVISLFVCFFFLNHSRTVSFLNQETYTQHRRKISYLRKQFYLKASRKNYFQNFCEQKRTDYKSMDPKFQLLLLIYYSFIGNNIYPFYLPCIRHGPKICGHCSVHGSFPTYMKVNTNIQVVIHNLKSFQWGNSNSIRQ